MTTAVVDTAVTADQFEATLNDDEKLKGLLANGKFGEWVKDYAKAQASEASGIGKQIREEVAATMTELVKDGLTFESVPGVELSSASPEDRVQAMVHRSRAKGSAYNADAPGAALDELELGITETFRAAYHKPETLTNGADAMEAYQKINDIQANYRTTAPADGGLLVPETVRSAIATIGLESSIVRSRATVIQMDGGKLTIPAVDSSSNASNIFGGIQFFWEDESAELTESKGKFRGVTLEPKELTALAVINNNLLDDAPAFESWFNQAMPTGHSWFEDIAFIGGSGADRPLGFQNANCVVEVAKEAGQAADTIVFNNLTKMYSRMLPSSLNSAVWIVNQETFPELAQLKLDAGNEAIWINNAEEGPPARIFGRPVLISEKMAALGDKNDIMFVDLTHYLVADRQAMQMSSSPHVKFTSNQTVYRFISRVDGRPWLNDSITPLNGANNLSPFVTLAERA